MGDASRRALTGAPQHEACPCFSVTKPHPEEARQRRLEGYADRSDPTALGISPIRTSIS